MPSSATASASRRRKSSSRRDDDAPIIPILARKVREVEAKAQKGKLGPTNRVKFQVIAFLVREERARVKADTEITDSARAELLSSARADRFRETPGDCCMRCKIAVHAYRVIYATSLGALSEPIGPIWPDCSARTRSRRTRVRP